MRGWVGEGLQKGKARPAKAVGAEPQDGSGAAAWTPWPAGAWVVLAGPAPRALEVAVRRGRAPRAAAVGEGGKGGGRRGVPGGAPGAVVVVDVWGRPPPPAWAGNGAPTPVSGSGGLAPVYWARAAGPSAAAALLEALLVEPAVGCIVLRALPDLTPLPRWPRAGDAGAPAALCQVRRRGTCVVALVGCPRPGACRSADGRALGAGEAGLCALDARHAQAAWQAGARGREMLEWASLRAQTCQPAKSALAWRGR